MSASPGFTSHIPSLVASAAGTVLAAVAGSYLGVAGTLAGLIAGSLITGVAAWWIERAVRRSAELARAKARAVRHRGGRPLTEHETQIITAIVDARHRRQFHWRLAAWIAGGALVFSAGLITAWELTAGKPVSAIVSHQPGHGLTVDGGAAITAQRSPQPLPGTPTPVASTPTLVPSPSASPSLVPTPPATTVPVPVTSSPVPTVTPSGPSTSPAPSVTGAG